MQVASLEAVGIPRNERAGKAHPVDLHPRPAAPINSRLDQPVGGNQNRVADDSAGGHGCVVRPKLDGRRNRAVRSQGPVVEDVH